MSAHFQRGELLYDQDRYEQAAGEFQAHLADQPEDAYAHCLLALSLGFLKKYQDALEHAQQAIAIAPDMGFAHFALGRVELERNRFEPAAEAIGEAIRCEPYTAGYYGVIAIIRVRQRRWAEALAAANEGLSCNPEDLNCLNMRAVALRNLGAREAAGDSIRDALARDPNNAFSHANQGWSLLETGHAHEALTHFREALRLQPDLELARQGIIEALKARNRFYRLILRYLLWLGKKRFSTQVGVAMGLIFIIYLVNVLASTSPGMKMVFVPIKVALFLALASTWFAQPMLNLALLFHPLGRVALSSDQKWQGALAGLCATIYVGLYLLAEFTKAPIWQFDAFVLVAFFTMPALSIHDCQRGWPRWTCIALTVAAPIAVFLPRLTWLFLPENIAAMMPMNGRAFLLYLLALVVGLVWLTDKLEDVEQEGT